MKFGKKTNNILVANSLTDKGKHHLGVRAFKHLPTLDARIAENATNDAKLTSSQSYIPHVGGIVLEKVSTILRQAPEISMRYVCNLD